MNAEYVSGLLWHSGLWVLIFMCVFETKLGDCIRNGVHRYSSSVVLKIWSAFLLYSVDIALNDNRWAFLFTIPLAAGVFGAFLWCRADIREQQKN